MKKFRILIVEDEPIIADDIAYTLEDLGYIITGIAHDAQDALIHVKLESPDLVLLDINLGGEMDGIEIAQIIKDQFQIPFMFLTSLSDRNTLERAKITSPLGYIVKPFDHGDLLTSIEVAMHNYVAKNKKESQTSILIEDAIFIKDHHRYIKVPIADILFAQAANNYCFIHTIEKRYLLSLTLKAVVKKLKDWPFMRIHRSYLINLTHVSEIIDRRVVIAEHQLPVSKQHYEDLMKTFRSM